MSRHQIQACVKRQPLVPGVLPLLHDTVFVVLVNVFSEAVIEVSEQKTPVHEAVAFSLTR